MSGQHLSDDELIAQLYGLESHDVHLNGCRDCAARSSAMERRRAESAAPVAASIDFLASQRRNIYARLDARPAARTLWTKLGPAVAAACLLTVGMCVYHPPRAVAPVSDSGDAQLFSEVYAMEQSVEPQAAAPIHGLFEDNQ